MDVGLSVESRIPGLDGSELVQAVLQRVRAAEDAGLASLHIGDKHRVSEPYLGNIAIAAHLAGRWERRLGVLVVNTLWNPVLLAEQLATLSAMTTKLDVVVALGEGEAEFGAVGVPISKRRALFTDGFAVTRALLDDQTVTSTVGPFDIVSAQVNLTGDAKISWLIAASAPAAIRRAAQLGVGWLASAKLAPADAIEALATYRDAGGTGRAVLRRDMYVGSSDEDVANIAEPVIAAGHRGYTRDAMIAGTIGQVGQDLRHWADTGFDEVLARSLAQTQDDAIASISLLGQVSDEYLRPD